MLSRPGFLSHVPTTCGVGSRPPRYRPRLDALTGPESRPDALACATWYETTGPMYGTAPVLRRAQPAQTVRPCRRYSGCSATLSWVGE